MKLTTILFALFVFSGCSDDKPPAADEPAPRPAQVSSAEVCDKAAKCIEGLLESDPDRAKDYKNVWAMVEKMSGNKKKVQCRQILSGAAYNPKAPAACK